MSSLTRIIIIAFPPYNTIKKESNCFMKHKHINVSSFNATSRSLEWTNNIIVLLFGTGKNYNWAILIAVFQLTRESQPGKTYHLEYTSNK